MRHKITYRILERLIGIDPAGLIFTILILLVCALPAAAIIASVGMMHASTFLIALFFVASLIAGMFWAHMAAMYWVDKHMIDVDFSRPILRSVNLSVEMPEAEECSRPLTREYRQESSGLRLKRMEYAEYLLSDVLPTRGACQMFYHQGP